MASKNGINFTHLMNSGQFSDLTLVCQGKEFKIHKLVACSQSSVIAAALKGEFKEAQSGIINIELFDAETVRRMIEYLYTGDYDQLKKTTKAATTAAVAKSSAAPVTAPTTTPSIAPVTTPSVAPRTTTPTVKTESSSAPASKAQSKSALVVAKGTLHHVQVNAIADYYSIQGLALLANSKIQRAYFTKWDPTTFVASAKAAIDVSGDTSLHSMMALLAAQNLKDLVKSGQLPNLVGDFATSILSYHAHQLEASKRDQSQVAAQQQQQALAQAQQQHQQAQLALQQQVNDLQVRCQGAEARAARIVQNVGKLINLSNNQQVCRNGSCGEDFGSYVEATGDPAEPMYILRCAWCQCRHTAH